jgi:SAM-dependent methyltransferase
MTSRITGAAKQLLGPRLTTVARVLMRGGELPQWGNLRRTEPFSDRFGFDRGTPIDRFYLERFLDAERAAIRGAVLEIQVSGHAKKFGRELTRIDTLDISSQFSPTYHCDLADAGSIVPSGTYDCFLLPNTLQHLARVDQALVQALRVVKPGGVILASAAGLLRLTAPDEDYWRFSAAGWRHLAARVWPGCAVEVRAHGNCLAAVAALYGLAVEELTRDELELQDERFPVLTTIKCVKPASAHG